MAHVTTAFETSDADFHQRIKTRRLAAGYTLEGALMALHRVYPGWAPKMSTLHRLETKTTEERADALVLIMLAKLYGCGVGDLSPARSHLSTDCLSDLLSTDSRWMHVSAGQGRFELALTA